MMGIYIIKSILKPDRFYIGSSVQVTKRWKQHIRDLRGNRHHSKKMQRHFNKYGEGDLVFSMLLECDINSIIKNEQIFLDSLSPFFNGSKIANPSLSPNRKGHIPWNKGKRNIYSPETIKKMSIRSEAQIAQFKRVHDRKRGVPLSEETKSKQRGRTPWNKGLKNVQVAWNKGLSLGYVPSGAFKKGLIPWNKGKNGISEETKNKMIEAQRLRHIREGNSKKQYNKQATEQPQ